MSSWLSSYERLTLPQLSEVTGIPLSTLSHRKYMLQWPKERLTEPSHQRGKALVVEGKTLKEWAEIFPVDHKSLQGDYFRMRKRGRSNATIVNIWTDRYSTKWKRSQS